MDLENRISARVIQNETGFCANDDHRWLPDAAIQESFQQMQAVIKNAGLYFPHKRPTVNLAPDLVCKEGIVQ